VDATDKVDVYTKVGHITAAADLLCSCRPCSYSPKTAFLTNIFSLVEPKRLANSEVRGNAAVIPMTGRE